MLISYMFYLPSCRGYAFIRFTAIQQNEGNVKARTTPQAGRSLCDWLTNWLTIGCFLIMFRFYEQIGG